MNNFYETKDETYQEFKIEYHAISDTWWKPLLSYGKWYTELKIYLLISFIKIKENDTFYCHG